MMNVLFLLNVSCSLLIKHKWNTDTALQLMNVLIKRSPCPAYNLIIFFHPHSNYLWYFSSSQGLMAILSQRHTTKTFIMPSEIKKETCLRIVFFCQMRQKDQMQYWRILSSWCSVRLRLRSVLWNHTLWLRRGGQKPNNIRQTALCVHIHVCLNECVCTYA